MADKPSTQAFARALRSARPSIAIACIAPLVVYSHAQAQDVPEVEHTYALPAGPLGTTLNQFAADSGVTLSFQPAQTAGLQAAPLSGRYTVPDALQRLLKGSGLEPVQRSDGSYVLRQMPTSAMMRDSGTLATINVTSTAPQEDPRGPVNGYIATRTATATKTDTAILEVPQSVSVVTADQITAQAAQNLMDALGYTAGVARVEGTDHTTDSLMIRGFSAGAGYGSIYRDGSKFSVNSYDGPQELYGFERVELLRGAASLLYGTAAPGGIVNMVTKQPTDEALHEIGVEYGNHNREVLKGDFSGPVTSDGVWSYRVTGLFRNSDSFIDTVDDDRRYLSGSLRWQPSESTSLTLQAEYLHNNTKYQYGLPTSGTILPNVNGMIPSSRFTGIDGYDKYVGNNLSFGYEFEHAFSDSLKLRQSAHAFRSLVNFPSSYEGGVSDDGTTSTYNGAQDRHDVSKALTTDTSLEWKFDTGPITHTLLTGVDSTVQHHTTRRYDRDESPQFDYYGTSNAFTLGDPTLNTYYPDSSVMDTGIYVQDQMKIASRWIFLAGGRYDSVVDHEQPIDGGAGSKYRSSALTGHVGVVYLADHGIAPYLSFSQSFEPQTGDNRLGVHFDPTRGQQYEAGIRYQPTSDTLLSAAIYQLTQSNVLDTDPVDTNFQMQTGKIRSRGIELEAHTRIGKAFNVIAAYAYTDARVTEDSDPTTIGSRRGAVPYNQFSLWGDYNLGYLGVPGLMIGAGVRYVGSTNGVSVDGTVPAFTLFDAVVAYETGRWRFAVNGTNLSDKVYIASCTYGCFYGQRRSVIGSATYKW